MTESYIGMGVTPGDVAAWHATPSGSMLDHNLEYATSLSSTAPVYHTDTRMPDGRLGLVVDPGSVCNLSGGNWALGVAKEGLKNIRKPDQKKHNHPLQVSGVGNSSQQATHNVVLPICLSQEPLVSCAPLQCMPALLQGCLAIRTYPFFCGAAS